MDAIRYSIYCEFILNKYIHTDVEAYFINDRYEKGDKMKEKKLSFKLILVTISVLTIVASGMFFSAHASYNSWNAYDTPTFYGAGGVSLHFLDVMREVYGQEGLDLYLAALATGDFYQYRSYTGFWQASVNDPKLRAYTMPDRVNPLWWLEDLSHSNEEFLYDYLGPYGTAADYITICNQYGVTPFSKTYAPGTDVYAVANGQMPKSGPTITLKQYLANHPQNSPATATATTVTTNAAVEALKTYSGNNAEFNAYAYYTRYADLQSAIGANGDALLKHWQAYGKAEGRVAK